MSCSSCSRRTLNLFIRSLARTELPPFPRVTASNPLQSGRSFSVFRHSRQVEDAYTTVTTTSSPPVSRSPRKPKDASDSPTIKPSFRATNRVAPREARKDYARDRHSPRSPQSIAEHKPTEREPWQVQKEALKEKLGGEAWNPRKKLSPDAMEGIRHLHASAPDRFTTPILARHFKVSPDAIRRILKSKWKPSDEEQEERLKRWDKRGEQIWSNLVELGVKPPKRWRQMGVGRAAPGSKPRWKSNYRNTVTVQDSFSEDLIPIVEKGESAKPAQWQDTSFSERLM